MEITKAVMDTLSEKTKKEIAEGTKHLIENQERFRAAMAARQDEINKLMLVEDRTPFKEVDEAREAKIKTKIPKII